MSSEDRNSCKGWIIRLEDPLDEIGNGVFKCKYFNNKGKSFAVKIIESGNLTSDEDWQSLMDLRNENVVSYHCCYVTNSVRYIVMDLCWASMMDFYLGRLQQQFDVEIDRIMRETAVGLDFLHGSNIIHGRLGLDNILLWRKRPNLKFIVKISGYYPHHQRSTNNHRQAGIEDDLDALGCVFYSMAANDVHPPKQLPVSSSQLSLISFNQRNSASQMINSLLHSTESDNKPTSVKDLLMGQSFFKTISATAEDRMRNVKELEDFIKAINLNNLELERRIVFNVADINGLKEILNKSKDVDELATMAMDKYPKLFAEFVWDLSVRPPLENLTFVERSYSSYLGGGAVGIVLAGKWIKPNGEEMPVACKRFDSQNNGTDKFYKEYEALRQLDHLFVVKCFGTCEIDLDKCILMELCEGSLRNYVLGELKSIPKDSLDDKIILGQVTLGLAYIHSQEMIHKDLKPDNILLWRSPNCQSLVVAKLADFNFAKQLKTAKSEFSATYHRGTEGYMAPELLDGLSSQQNNVKKRKVLATVASDAYSLGITIGFTVLKGKHPFGNVLMRDEMMKNGADPILLGHLEWDVTDLILRLTRTDPKERPNVHFLIYHPYFVSANEKSKEHFVEKLDDYFNLFLSPYQARMTYINKLKIEKWMAVVTSQKERESNAKMKIWLAQGDIFLKDLAHLENSQKYYDKIKVEIQRGNENQVNNSFHNETSKSESMMDYFRDWTLWTRRLIQSAPQFSLIYFYCLINDRIVEEHPPGSSQHSVILFRQYHNEKENEVKPPDILRAIQVLQIEEHVHACLHFKCREEIEEIWNPKRAGLLSDPGLVGDEEIHRLLRELPSYAAPSSIINNLINRMDNIDSKYDKDETTVLHWILKNRWEKIDFSILEQLLKKRKANVNVGDKNGTTPVHYAAKSESSQGPAILRFLLENGGDPDQVNGRERQRTPLHYAAMNESSYAPSLLKILLDYKAQVNVDDKHGFTPLHYAARNVSDKAPDMLKDLLDRGGEPNKTLIRMGVEPPFHRTPVHMATLNDSQSGSRMLKILLERDGDPNVYDMNRETPLHYVAMNPSNFAPEMMKILLENKGFVNLKTHRGKLPIHFAAENQSPSGPSIMDVILRHGGNPNAVFLDGGSPVHHAATNPSASALKILEILLNNKGDPNQLSGFSGASPVHLAAESQFSNGLCILKLLLDNGGDPNAANGDGRTPVHSAAKNRSDMAPHLLKLLLTGQTKGNPNAGDKKKVTPIHLAAASKSESAVEILKILLENGANPNVADDENQETPVHYAAKNESSFAPSILLFLLDNGGNCNVFNRRNQTPFVLAVENTSDCAPRLLEILLVKGFDPNVANPSGATSVHLAASNRSNSGPKILTLLLAKGNGNCNAVDRDNKTPLHYATANKSIGAAEMVNILLDQGCDPDAISSMGLTPVHLAAKNTSSSALSILKLLHKRGADLTASIPECGTTAVHLAAETQSNTDVMEFLLGNVANDCVNAFDVCRENFLKYNMDDINWRFEELQSSPGGNQRMRTPVHYAAENETVSAKPNVLKLLLGRGGDPNLRDERDRTAVHLAVRNGGLEGWRILKILLKNKGNPNDVDYLMRTPVHLSAMKVTTLDKVKLMQLLMKYEGNPNAVDSAGRTPVHYAAMNASPRAPETIELLLENGGNPNLADHLGLTPVHCCVSVSMRMTEKILELLLKHGGDPDVPDNQGKTPNDLMANSESSDKENCATF